MRFIYLKIFAWFWIAMIAVGVTLVFVVVKTGDEPMAVPWRERSAAFLPLQAERIVEVVEQQGLQGLKQYELNDKGSFPGEMHLLDDRGIDLTGRFPTRNIQELARRAEQSGKVEFLDDFQMHGVAVRVAGPSGRRYVYALQMNPGLSRPPPFHARPAMQMIRILAVVGVGGFVCFWLARYITSPVSELRAATRALAGGNLRTRIAPRVCRRSDELGDLGIDFNTMAERIQTLLESQHRLLRDISHELRSPLTRLRVALDLAKEGADVSSIRAHQRIEFEADKINEMVGNLLRLSRLETLAELPQKSEIDLGLLVEQAADEAAFEAIQQGRSVNLVRVESCTMVGNEDLLHSVLENLIRNAIRYTSEGTAIEIELVKRFSPGNAYAILWVRDRGPGVPEVHLANIFEAFFRVEDSRNHETGGTGLGLSIAQRAVHLHNGTIRAINRPSGGLEIEVRLPLEQVRLQSLEHLQTAQQTPRT